MSYNGDYSDPYMETGASDRYLQGMAAHHMQPGDGTHQPMKTKGMSDVVLTNQYGTEGDRSVVETDKFGTQGYPQNRQERHAQLPTGRGKPPRTGRLVQVLQARTPTPDNLVRHKGFGTDGGSVYAAGQIDTTYATPSDPPKSDWEKAIPWIVGILIGTVVGWFIKDMWKKKGKR